MNKKPYDMYNAEFSEELIRAVLEEWWMNLEDMELDEGFCDILDYGEEEDIAEMAVEFFAHDLYEYMKENRWNPAPVMNVETGKSVLIGNYPVLDWPGVCIGKQKVEYLHDIFMLENSRELWLLENGMMAEVRCIEYCDTGDYSCVEYRYVENYLFPHEEPNMLLECVTSYMDCMLHADDYEEYEEF